MELPEITFCDDFYFWFNTETKKEYYATPLYFYKADYHLDIENKLRDVYYKETEKTDNGLKHLASLYFPYFETWKTQAKDKINLMKKGKLTEDEIYKWIIGNK